MGSRYGPGRRRVRPDEVVQGRSRLPEGERPARVRDRGLDLPAMPDDSGVAEQPPDVALSEASDAFRVEAGERAPERVALAQDRDPGETRLEAFQADALVEPALVPDRAAPFLVVVGEVQRVARLPAANDRAQSTSTLTTPSSTRTG